ncbi:MAG: hypothetical protein IPK22_19830 [Verrucomicrobiaceae bacterium]|nr:hypothetical protein [Verrucomicrobiaceae bacterium]
MEPDPTDNSISTACVGDCQGHAVNIPNWTQVTVVGNGDTARANVYQVAVAGVGGKATYKDGGDGGPTGGAHGVVAVASQYGHAIAGNGGVAISNGGLSEAEGWAIAHTKGGIAKAKSCGVAVAAGGYASAEKHGIGIGWFSNSHPSRVEAGPGGVAIGDTGCFVKVGKDGVLIALAHPNLLRTTKICRVGECGGLGEIKADQWYEIVLDNEGQFQFKTNSPPKSETPESPCPLPPMP